MMSTQVPVVLQLVEKLVKSLDLDKTTNKSLEKFAHACKQCLHRVTATIEEPLPGATDDARFVTFACVDSSE